MPVGVVVVVPPLPLSDGIDVGATLSQVISV
jgi:hypothetical protein